MFDDTREKVHYIVIGGDNRPWHGNRCLEEAVTTFGRK
jgi:hypothetical protein